MRACVFCNKLFNAVGKHYSHCKSRDGRPYVHLLAYKRGKHTHKADQPFFRACPTCGKQFKRLDVHFRHKASCRDPLNANKSQTPPQQQPHSGSAVDAQHENSTVDNTITEPVTVSPYSPSLDSRPREEKWPGSYCLRT